MPAVDLAGALTALRSGAASLPLTLPRRRRRDGRRRKALERTAAGSLAAVERTAAAVLTLPDSSLIGRLSRGRLWIGVLGLLMAGIVAINVASLRLGAGSGATAERVQRLDGVNSEMRAKIARQTSTRVLQRRAAELGMMLPEPGQIRYLESRPGDGARAAARLRKMGTVSGAKSSPTPAPHASSPTATAPKPGTTSVAQAGATAAAAAPAAPTAADQAAAAERADAGAAGAATPANAGAAAATPAPVTP